MPADKQKLPSTLERSAEKVKRAYEKTLQSAEEEYHDEARAHRTAWASVKHIAEKKGDHWELKDEPGPSDAQAARSGAAARDRPVPTAGGVDAGKTKDELLADAREADIAGRSSRTQAQLVDALKKHNDRETAKARRR
jgi:hypothetical protein